jgi:peptidyl-tRNA hydrolase
MSVVQYLIVRSDLLSKYGPGILAVQTAHASVAPLTKALTADSHQSVDDALESETKEWVNGTFTKIILAATDEEALLNLEQRLSSNGVDFNSIRESNLDGELTAIGLKPYEKKAVSEYLSHFELLGFNYNTDQISFKVNENPVNVNNVTYNPIDLGQRDIENSSRYVLQVDSDLLDNLFGQTFQGEMELYRAHGGSGDDYIDSLNETELLPNLRDNNPLFSDYLINNYGEELLDVILPRNDSKTVSLTSIDGIFVDGPNVYIYGGCQKVD